MPAFSAKCPIRPGDPCSLCQPGADGPHNCGLVYLVMDDPELREQWNANRAQQRAKTAAQADGGAGQ
ncbi:MULTISPECIES: DUF6767 domain-containing protein [unclassified Luteococcus]|uniref:DUF6767 domain-containing protein n=1 Tax=unclassified Luteococcus TaxID=2639923 RepID=UPI00313CB297